MANQNRYWTILTGIGNKKWDVFKQYNLVAIDVPMLKSQGLEGRNTIDYFINEINLEDIIIAIIPNKFTGSSGFMGISTANSNQNPLGATVTALPCRQ